MPRRSLFTTCLAFGLTTAALAQDHLRLKGGEWLSGRAVAYDHSTRVVTFESLAGELRDLRVRDLDPLSAYKLARTQADRDDPRNELLLGDFARDIELFVHAGDHYQRALDLDPGLSDEVEAAHRRLRHAAADYCLHQADAALARGDAGAAERWLATLVTNLPDEASARRATSLLAESFPRHHGGLDDELERDHGELLRAELRAPKRYYDIMLRNIQRGLTSTRREGAARRALEAAWKDGERAAAELERAGEDLGDDPAAASALAGYHRLVREHRVATALHLAGLLTTRTDHREALKWVERALAVEPQSQEAAAARARIEATVERGWGWRWNAGR